ncbi:FhaA domain-containing protein [Mycetocola reblochoni]|uniref:FhaA domain-containing protein n=1 Tax=Mycetocola reblochoni TaxID=331618 RepID=UPI003F975ABC
MGLLDSFERGLERAVNGAFAKTFRSGVQPVEIAAAVRSELDTRAAVVSRDRILAPHNLTVWLSRGDAERLIGIGDALLEELLTDAARHARAQGYTFTGPLTISLEAGDDLSDGMLRIDAGQVTRRNVSWKPVLEINGVQHPITRSRTVVGRGSDADITVQDSGTSRRHVEILWDGSNAQVHDLGSTNGSTLDGQRISQAALEPGGVIVIGRTRIVFRLLADDGDLARTGGRA